MTDTDTTTISQPMADALGLDTLTPSLGNLAAHAIHVAYSCSHGEMAGFAIGWADESPAVIDFIVGVVTAADEHGIPFTDDDRDDDVAAEIADQAVPIYTGDVWAAASRLREYLDDDEMNELAGPDARLEKRLQIGLYGVARRILDVVGG